MKMMKLASCQLYKIVYGLCDFEFQAFFGFAHNPCCLRSTFRLRWNSVNLIDAEASYLFVLPKFGTSSPGGCYGSEFACLQNLLGLCCSYDAFAGPYDCVLAVVLSFLFLVLCCLWIPFLFQVCVILYHHVFSDELN